MRSFLSKLWPSEHLLPIYRSEGRFSSTVLPHPSYSFSRHVLAILSARAWRIAILVYVSTREIQDLALYLNAKKLLEADFFRVLICITKALAVLQRTFLVFSLSFFCRFWADCVQFPLFSLDQAFSHSSKGGFFCYDASLIVALALPSVCLSAVCPGFPLSPFSIPSFLLSSNPVASLAATSPFFIPLYVFVSRYPSGARLV